MKTAALLLILLAQLFFLGCSNFPLNYSVRIWEFGEVDDQEFAVRVPMETRLGLRILKVEIEGETYDFLIDTGAATLLSPELFKKLGIKAKEVVTIRDSQGNRDVGKIGVLPSMQIGGISFKGIGVLSYKIDMNSALSCLKIDGIIGSNLMQHAVWQFDFVQNELRLYSQIPNDLNNPIAFATDQQKRPYVNISPAEGMDFPALLDLGFNGMLDLLYDDYLALEDKESLLFPLEAIGANSYGLIGKQARDTLKFAIIPKLKLGDSFFTPASTEFAKVSSRKLGLELFEKNTLTMDWKSRNIFVEEKDTDKSVELSHVGFKLSLQADQLIVDLMYEDSIAKQLGLTLGDTVTNLNGRSFVNIDMAEYCHFLSTREEPSDTITIEVKKGPAFQSYRIPRTKFVYSMED